MQRLIADDGHEWPYGFRRVSPGLRNERIERYDHHPAQLVRVVVFVHARMATT